MQPSAAWYLAPIFLGIAVTLFSIILITSSAFALSCAPYPYTWGEEFDQVDLVFIGSVTEKEYLPSKEVESYEKNAISTLQVEEIFKGSLNDTVKIKSDEALWGIYLIEDWRFLIFGFDMEDYVSVDPCGNSGSLPPIPDLEEIEAIKSAEYRMKQLNAFLLEKKLSPVDQKIPNWIKTTTGFDPPLKQMKQGIPPSEVICNEGLQLIMRNGGSSACVRLETAIKLEERGWGVVPPPCCKDMPHTFTTEAVLGIAQEFIKSSPTFAFDGIEETLSLELVAIRESFPEQYVIEADFESLHGGYGDRADEMVIQVITPYSMNLVVINGEVTSAILDGKWDELNQLQLPWTPTKGPVQPDDTVSHGGPVTDYVSLIDNLRASGATVNPEGEIEQPFFSVTGFTIQVNGASVQVFEYDTAEDAEADASLVSEDGSSIGNGTGTSMPFWVSDPHFYYKERIIVLYVGDDPNIVELLESVLGSQFAGR